LVSKAQFANYEFLQYILFLEKPRCSWSGTSVAETWGCCSSSKPCGSNEGDCDSDNDCSGNLKCGVNNCVGSQFHPAADCCIEQGNQMETCRKNRVQKVAISSK
jgi:hypothetical protein